MVSDLKPIRSRQKVLAAQQSLRELAKTLGAHNKLPTVRDICRGLRISAVTLEHVLAGLEEQGVITRRQGSGIYVSPRLYQKNVGLVFGRNAFGPGASPFCAILVEACQARAREHSDNFSFYLDLPSANGSEQHPLHADLSEAISRKRLDGILLVSRHSLSQEVWLRKQGLPVVSFCGGVVSPFAPMTVGFDLKEMATKGIMRLREHGCTRLAAVTPGKSGVAAFSAAMREQAVASRDYGNLNAVDGAPETLTRFELGQRAMHELLLGADARPDGVVVFDDMLAAGAVAMAQELGLKVGQDLLIASHTNRGSSVLEHAAESLVLLEADPTGIAEAMFTTLETLMTGNQEQLPAVMVPLSVRIGSEVRTASN